MQKYIRAVICLVFFATTIGQLVAQDDAICKALRAIHATYEYSLSAYLSEKGEDCLGPTATPTPEPTLVPSEPIWTASGRSSKKVSVSLELTRGLYTLNVIETFLSRGVGFAILEDLIVRPRSCYHWDALTFPAELRVKGNCQILGRLNVYANKSWRLSITKVSGTLPPIPKADGWSVQGRGYTQRPVELRFERGTYQFTTPSRADIMTLTAQYQSPSGCVPWRIEMPGFIEAKSSCTIVARVRAYDYVVSETGSWSYRIEKLD